MTNNKTTRRALLSSALSLVLCMAMLIGTTFAWFTDSVTSTGNIIKSGTLDVTMEWADGKTDPTSTTWKDASTGAIFDYALWEPGYTEVRHIKIGNAGSLALKYQLNIVANGEVSELADVIDVYYVDPAVQVADRTTLTADMKIGTLTEVLDAISTTASGHLLAGENDTITLALKMQESAGNEYQGLSIGSGFSVQLLATQLTSEEDSFDNQYDKMATIDNKEELLEALAADYDLIQLGANIALTDSIVIPADKTVAIDLAGYTISQEKGDISTSFAMICNKGALTVKDSVGVGKISFADTTPYTADIGWASNTIRNEGTLNVNGGTIENLTAESVMKFSYPHAIDCYPGSVTNVNGGTVKSLNYDSIRMFCNSTTLATTVNINGGTIVNRVSFQNPNNNTHTPGYGVLNIAGGNFVTTGNVSANVRLLNFSRDVSNMKATVTGGTFDKGFKTQDHANCNVKTSDWLNYNGAEAVATTDSELKNALAHGGTIALASNITTAENTFVVPSGKTATLKMNGHTIDGTFNATSNANKNLFDIKGTLIVDGEGLITMNTTGLNMGWNAMSCILCVNGGDLTVNNTTIVNKGGTDMAYAIDTNPWNSASNTILDVVLNNVKVESTYRGIRVRDNGPYLVKLVATDSDIDEIWYQKYAAGDNVNKGNYGILVEVILNNTTCDTSRVDSSVLTIN